MSFFENVDKTESKTEHRFELNFSKKYIKGKTLLNIGSWTGPFEILAISHASKITAVDIDEGPLKVLKKNIPQVKCVKASVEKLPFKNNAFEVVTFWAVIEHIPSGYELAALREINRVLKKGGYLFLTTMSHNILSNLFDPAYWLVGHRHYKKEALGNMLKDAGFYVEKISETGSFITALHAWGFYFFKHIFHMGMPEVDFIEKAFEDDFLSPGFYQLAIRAKKI